MTMFKLDERLEASCFELVDWPLSKILLKNNKHYPWLILVPRHHALTEITQLSPKDSHQLMDEIHRVSVIMKSIFKPDKINTGALGNQVPQFHMHVIARFKTDPLWPEGVWQASLDEQPYTAPDALIARLKACLSKDYLDGNF
ncbi:MAG: HIT family protein [Legionellaceae bacterium]|nr:HIT family protein [Legionellaceae bacterium]